MLKIVEIQIEFSEKSLFFKMKEEGF